MQTDDLMAWLGSAADDLTPEQIKRIADASRDIDARYHHLDERAEREAALSATVQYLLNYVSAEDVSRALVAARQCEREAYIAALQVAVMMTRDGVPKAVAARKAGVDRISLLKALGRC